MSNIVMFPRLAKLRRQRKPRLTTAPSDRFCAVTARRLRVILAKVLEVLDSLERAPRRQ